MHGLAAVAYLKVAVSENGIKIISTTGANPSKYCKKIQPSPDYGF
jgi:hypothetical protein